MHRVGFAIIFTMLRGYRSLNDMPVWLRNLLLERYVALQQRDVAKLEVIKLIAERGCALALFLLYVSGVPGLRLLWFDDNHDRACNDRMLNPGVIIVPRLIARHV